jgi:hypothetical protein
MPTAVQQKVLPIAFFSAKHFNKTSVQNDVKVKEKEKKKGGIGLIGLIFTWWIV